jgi:hypothetical protein
MNWADEVDEEYYPSNPTIEVKATTKASGLPRDQISATSNSTSVKEDVWGAPTDNWGTLSDADETSTVGDMQVWSAVQGKSLEDPLDEECPVHGNECKKGVCKIRHRIVIEKERQNNPDSAVNLGRRQPNNPRNRAGNDQGERKG